MARPRSGTTNSHPIAAAMNDGEICARLHPGGEAVRVRWSNGRIQEVASSSQPAPPDRWIAPGLVDLQVNGYGGVDFQQDDLALADLLLATRRLREAGCTRFLLTLVTDEWSRLMARLERLHCLRERSAELRHAIAGWHVEGPFLSGTPGFCGAHQPALMIDPTAAHIAQLRALTADVPVLLTLAPERAGALAAIEQATRLGIKVSLGHTNASTDQIAEAVRCGAVSFTHLGNGCPRDLDRHDNILWRILETQGLQVSLIPDGTHVSPALFRLIHRQLASGTIYYITDAMAAAGAKPGRYTLGSLQLEVGADEIVRLPGHAIFAGSALRPIAGVFRAANMLGCSWQEAWSRFSAAPARLMGLPAGLGVGAPADFCVLRVTAAGECMDLEVHANGALALG